MIQASSPSRQWVVVWDDEASGYRATAGDLLTGAYTSYDAALRAAERGDAAPQRAKRAEGLVPCQQSFTQHPAPPAPQGATNASRLAAVMAARRASRLPGGEASASAGEAGECPVSTAASCHRVAAGRPELAPAPRPFPKTDQRGRRWRITLTDGEKKHQVDSQIARLVRCQRRVKAWSDALPKLNRRWRRALKGRAGPRIVMLTLTYREADAWEPNHIRGFMLSLRKELKSKLWAYSWVLEMQERGAPHYHVLLYVAPNTDVPAPDEAGLWPYGVTRRETAKRGPKYILTYVGKEYQKEGLPHGARMFAVHIGKKTATEEELFGFRLSAAPPWLQKFIEEARALVGPGVRWKRQPGGGWLIKNTGEVLQSAWWLFDIEPIEPHMVTGREEEQWE